MSCFVPDCNNSLGMPFPENPGTKRKWLESLGTEGVEPNEKSFVCLDHFRPSDIIEQSNFDGLETDLNPESVRNLVVLRKGAIPFMEEEEINWDSDENLKACRVCGCNENLERNIFEKTENGTTVMSMIMLCSYPIVITKMDNLPKFICTNCMKLLQKAFKFRLKCLKTNKMFKEKLKNQGTKKIRLEIPKTTPSNEELITILKGDDEENEMKTCQNKSPLNNDSKIGEFSYSYVKGPLNSDYIISNGYLFILGLVKNNNVRYLRCISPNCKSRAKEFIATSQLNLEIGHNHKKPSEETRKKHMFFHVMRKKMQLDKNLNIRLMYEEISEQDPDIKKLIPLRNVINEICKHQNPEKIPKISSFEQLFERIEDGAFERLHFTNDNKQFYQEKFSTENGAYAIIFSNINKDVKSDLMYVDGSFQINNTESFEYHLITVLIWLDESYYPILFALVNKKNQEIFAKIFKHLRDDLAPNLKPYEIVTDYESSLYYALGEIYLDSHIGGSFYYYTQNIYKKICSLNLSKNLETNSNFRNIYHMLLMLPLLPVNTIEDALNTIKTQSNDLDLNKITEPIFEYINEIWIKTVTPQLFCVHHLENRISENVIAPFKKLRDYLLLFKGKTPQNSVKIVSLIEKLIELESFLRDVYTKGDKKSFSKDLTSFQKRNVIRAWLHIETYPKININSFFQKVLGYIKCMENQLWIWGFYGYSGTTDDVLISSGNFDVLFDDDNFNEGEIKINQEINDVINPEHVDTIVMEAVIDNNGGVVLQGKDLEENNKELENTLLNYVDKESIIIQYDV
nr:uncharacterized protein LOC111418369 [Onthophagus taurus]